MGVKLLRFLWMTLDVLDDPRCIQKKQKRCQMGVRLLRFHWMTLDVFGCPLMYQNETKNIPDGCKTAWISLDDP